MVIREIVIIVAYSEEIETGVNELNKTGFLLSSYSFIFFYWCAIAIRSLFYPNLP